jgi:alginate O-acetyltransferase complex protein AlgI
MLFSTYQFFFFLAAVLVLFYTAPRPLRRFILLGASYYFYMSWNMKFVLLLLTLTAIDYTAGFWISRTAPGAKKKLLLIASLSANLGFLGFFKYYNFLAGNLALVLGRPMNSFWLDIILPLGISFHTFQSMSYVVDVYRDEQKAITDPIDYALFIAFFPQLVAGPIVRAREFFGDFYHWRPPTSEEVLRGIMLVTLGLTKKMALADQFARISDAYFKNVTAQPGMLAAWSGALAFGIQVFFDFSGYSDMAIGMAQLLGFHFPENFRRPYLAASVSEYWRRWHLTLSRWLRDYLYIPLGGSRHGTLKTYRNLMFTMMLCGLWHGANWNFILWGTHQGVLLSIERALSKRFTLSQRAATLLYPLRLLLTMALILTGYAVFRAQSLTDSGYVLRQMFTGAPGALVGHAWHWVVAAATFVIAWYEEKHGWFEKLHTAPVWAYASTIAALLVFLELIAVSDMQIPFVYFQF